MENFKFLKKIERVEFSKIELIRNNFNLQIKEFCDILGITRQQYYRWEKRKYGSKVRLLQVQLYLASLFKAEYDDKIAKLGIEF